MAGEFERALALPLAHHTLTHAGRVLKVMLVGTNAMWGLWLSFFREHCASIAAKHKVPRYIWIREEALPRNASGKFLKRELRDTLKLEDAG